MKKLFALLLPFLTLAVSAQVKTFCLAPTCPQTISTADSVTISAQLVASDGYKSITWSQASGPAVNLPMAQVVNSTSLQATSSFQLKNLPAGTYTFNATGTSITGVSGTIGCSLTVIPVPRRIAYTVTVYTDSTRVINQ